MGAELPKGFTLDAPVSQGLPPGFTLDEASAAQTAAPPAAPQQRFGTTADAQSEPLMALGSGAIATPLAGLAGIAGTLLPGEQGQGARWTQRVQDALTYKPRTVMGEQGLDQITKPLQWLQKGADAAGGKVAEVTGSPAAGAAVNTAIQSAPALLTRGRVGNGSSSPSPLRAPVAAGEAEAVRTPPAQAGRGAGLEGVPEKPPSIEELKAQARDAYKRADDAGVVVTGDSFKGVKTRVATDLAKEGLDPTLHPAATAALKRITGSKGDLSLSNLDTLRQIASDARGSKSPGEARLAGKIVDHLDDYIENLSESDVRSGDPAAGGALKEARGLYQRQKKAEEIGDLIQRATDKSAGYSASGMENAVRREFINLASNKNRMRRFNSEEQAAIRQVARGGKLDNALRFMGKFGPTDRFGQVTGLLATASTGGVGAVLPIAGLVSRELANKRAVRGAQGVEELMRAGPQKNALRDPKRRNALAEP